MKKLFLFVCLILSSYTFSQETIAFDSETSTVNNLLYYKGKPFTGKEFSSDENLNINNECNCKLIKNYLNGKLNGSFKEWYNNGVKKYEGSYSNELKTGTHKWFYTNGKIQKETVFSENNIIKNTQYFENGNLQLTFSKDNNTKENVQKEYYQNNTLKKIVSYLNNKKHGVEKSLKEDGTLIFDRTFKNGDLQKEVYINSGGNKIKKEFTNTSEKRTTFFKSGTIHSENTYALPSREKEGIWLTYNENGEKVSEKKYHKNKLTEEGKYLNSKKEGIWKAYALDGKSETQTTYKEGKEISSKIIDYKKLAGKNFKKGDFLLYYNNTILATEEYCILRFKNTIKDIRFPFIKSYIKNLISKRGNVLRRITPFKDKEITGFIEVSDIFVNFKESTYQNTRIVNKKRVAYKEKGYDAFINYTIKIYDLDGKVYVNEKYKVNKSGKLLNSILSTALKSYSKTKQQAFKKAAKDIFLSNNFRRNFPVIAEVSSIIKQNSRAISKVEINKGSRYGVQKKMIFKVYNPTTKKLQAKLKVTKVTAETAICKVIDDEKWLKTFSANQSKIIIKESN